MRHSTSVLCALFLALACACTPVPVEEQVRSLGGREFAPEKWAVATQVEREQMLASFFAKHPVEKLTTRQVRQLLGEPTGYYDYDTNLAYVVGPETVESQYAKGRLLVFIIDKSTGEIDDIELIPAVR